MPAEAHAVRYGFWEHLPPGKFGFSVSENASAAICETKMLYALNKLFVLGTEKVKGLLFRQFLAAICFKVKYLM